MKRIAILVVFALVACASRAQVVAYRTDTVEGATKPAISTFVVGTRAEMLAFNWNTAGGGREMRWAVPVHSFHGFTLKAAYSYLPDLKAGYAVPWVAYRAKFGALALSSDFGVLVPIRSEQPARFLTPETSGLVTVGSHFAVGASGSAFRAGNKPTALRFGPVVRVVLPYGFTTRGWYGAGFGETPSLLRLELVRKF